MIIRYDTSDTSKLTRILQILAEPDASKSVAPSVVESPKASTGDKISKYFKLQEFFSVNDKGKTFKAKTPTSELLSTLDAIREYLGKALYIESGIRSVEYNTKLSGSASNSGHLTGEAADIYVPGLTNKQLGLVIRTLYDKKLLPYLTYTYLITGSSATRVHIGVDRKNRKSIWGTGY
jgi:uncharacterized protein YcbK (DUF882 family)